MVKPKADAQLWLYAENRSVCRNGVKPAVMGRSLIEGSSFLTY